MKSELKKFPHGELVGFDFFFQRRPKNLSQILRVKLWSYKYGLVELPVSYRWQVFAVDGGCTCRSLLV